jgi:hypothetical protein
VLAVNWPELGSTTPEDPLSDDEPVPAAEVSVGGAEVSVVELALSVDELAGGGGGGGGELLVVVVSREVVVVVELFNVLVVVDVLVETAAPVEFERAVELVVLVQLKEDIQLEEFVLFMLFIKLVILLGGTRQVVVVVFETDDVAVTSVELALEVLFEIVEGSMVVLLEVAVVFEPRAIHAGGGVGISLESHTQI